MPAGFVFLGSKSMDFRISNLSLCDRKFIADLLVRNVEK